MNIKQLKEKYDAKQIDEIEALAKNANELQEMQHKEFIGALFYLENTKRFKENPTYKAATFAEYTIGFYGLSVQTYNHYRFAYFRYPAESEKYGPGTIMNIVKKCGGEMVPTVIKAIEKEKKLDQAKKGEVIEKFAKTHLKKRKARPSYAEIERENIKLKKENQELQKRLKEVVEQNERLKAAVNRYESGIQRLVGPLASVENGTRPSA